MKLIVFLTAIAVVIGLAETVGATPKWVEVTVSADSSGNVAISPFPAGTELLNVMVYDDIKGIAPRSLGPQRQFQLRQGEGFNFTWRDSEGTWWQMITPKSRAGGQLQVDDNWRLGPCKYLFPARQ